jgi:hypothetical protein
MSNETLRYVADKFSIDNKEVAAAAAAASQVSDSQVQKLYRLLYSKFMQ